MEDHIFLLDEQEGQINAIKFNFNNVKLNSPRATSA